MKTSFIPIQTKVLVVLVFCFVLSNAVAQTPCFSIYNSTNCGAVVTWETMDGANAHIAGGLLVTISASGTLNITGAACASAADIYVRLEELGGFSTGQSQPINGVIQPSYINEGGNNNNTCNAGLWDINWNGTGNPVLIQ